MNKYIIHIFNVDDNGSIIDETMQTHKIFCQNNDEAQKQGEILRKERSLKEPLPTHPLWGQDRISLQRMESRY